MLRLLGIVLAVLSALVAAVLTWPSLFRVDQLFPVAQIVAFRSVLLVIMGAVALVALLLALARPLRLFALSIALIAAIALGANALTLVSRGLGTDSLPEKTADAIRVMTWNTAGSATSPESVAQIAVAMDADIVTLPETTIETGEAVALAMRDLGHRMWAHHAEFGEDGWDARSTTLLISPDLGDYAVIESSVEGTTNTSTVPSAVAMPVDGDGPTVVAAHAVAPRQQYMGRWRDDLSWLADQCGQGENVILAGDFNATIDHMGRLGVDGGTLGHCHDVASETGNGSVGTWPTKLPGLLGAPIDHVMSSEDWVPTGSIVLRSLDGSGSDHRPLIVQLEPAG
ncbi:endonuclease/exonuclease/phosphatase family protein [Microbacterium sp. BK668]|uniref:endonuclease/exonuclease/phosphatase family protein n=1 Tax=Microbacterium sp. BK668 TaxID=2512118 RepID=UPI00105DCA7F|nr:endonuclease/exonuclease/phosphatase family protein [Microbacterium sp. BK668]TDN92500.1 endonuclease/exonuclease/phosphatase (EEP) superfamily protein YafD [Microbacterium sp. BK668]